MMTPLDRPWFSYQRCSFCRERLCQLVIDRAPNSPAGSYLRLCWLCYWDKREKRWRLGPVVNAGVLWDGLDAARGSQPVVDEN